MVSIIIQLRQFKGVYRKLLAHVSIIVPLSANCIPRDDTILRKVSSLIVNDKITEKNPANVEEPTNAEEPIHIDPDELATIYDLLDDVQLSNYADDVVAYISGCVVKLIKKKISCTTCLEQLEIEKDTDGNDTSLPISKLQKRKYYGKLISASRDVIKICKGREGF